MMDEEKQSEEAMLYQNLQMLEEVRLALNEVIDGTSAGPGARFAGQILSVLGICGFLLTMVVIYPAGLGAAEIDLSGLLWRIGVCVAVMYVSIKMAVVWADGYVESKGTWDEFISSRLREYQAAKPDGLQYVMEQAVDGNLDAKVLKMWIEVEEEPALTKRLQDLLPRPTIRIAD